MTFVQYSNIYIKEKHIKDHTIHGSWVYKQIYNIYGSIGNGLEGYTSNS